MSQREKGPKSNPEIADYLRNCIGNGFPPTVVDAMIKTGFSRNVIQYHFHDIRDRLTRFSQALSPEGERIFVPTSQLEPDYLEKYDLATHLADRNASGQHLNNRS